MDGPPDEPHVLDLTDDLGSVRRAREHVRGRCRDAGVVGRTCDTAVLLTSEVVTNALVHARSAPRLGVSVGADGLRVEVADDDPRRPRPVLDLDAGADGGRGLRLVAELADDWGVAPAATGKVVWFSLTR